MTDWTLRKSILMSILAVALLAGGMLSSLGTEVSDDPFRSLALIAFGGAGLLVSSLRLWQAVDRRKQSDLEIRGGEIALSRTPTERIFLAIAFWITCLGFYFLVQSGLSSEKTRAFAWAGLFMCGIAPFVLAFRRMRLVISGLGLDYSPFKVGPIAWNDIASIEGKRSIGSDVVVLKLSDPQAYVRRGLPIGYRLLGWIGFGASPFRITTIQLGVSRQRIAQALQLWRDAGLAAAQPTRNTPSAPVGFGRRKTPV
jgi:hypothetical protein